MLSITDLFCGAGGSSSGAIMVPGVEVRMAANHWPLAIETHNTNHPNADHDCADLSQVDPRRYPTTDLLWASPSCTNHSQAKGRKRNIDATPDLFGETLPDEAAERSRATMWDVVRFAEHHHYKAIVVENVVDAAKWVLWPAWRAGLDALGYCVHVVYLNSMHAQALGDPAPQSRDRVYVVAHKHTTRCPDLNKWIRPKAYCPSCDQIVSAMQAWKKPEAPWGRYRTQYVWRCPSVACRNRIVEPWFLPAAAAIDWNLLGERIGDRDKPLADKTWARIAAGLERYCRPSDSNGSQPPHLAYADALAYAATMAGMMLVPCEGRDGKVAQYADQPMRTQTARNETGLALPPFVVELRGGGSKHRPVTEPLATVTAAGNHHGLLVPAGGTWNDDARPTGEAHRTLTTRDSYGLLVPYNRTGVARSTDDPHGTFTTRDRYALIMRNNTARGNPGQMVTPITEELRTLTTGGHQSLLHGELPSQHTSTPAIPAVEDCYFRMLEPHEIQAGMAFDPAYTVLGNKRAKVRQLGNAVTPPAARDLVAAVAESLGHGVDTFAA